MRWTSLAGLLVAVGLAGCYALPTTSDTSNVDWAQVARIERAAASAGVQVYWVNMPQKRNGS